VANITDQNGYVTGIINPSGHDQMVQVLSVEAIMQEIGCKLIADEAACVLA
jgi:chemotaxis signal transduction protein